MRRRHEPIRLDQVARIVRSQFGLCQAHETGTRQQIDTARETYHQVWVESTPIEREASGGPRGLFRSRKSSLKVARQVARAVNLLAFAESGDTVSNPIGWFADLDEDQNPPMWRPCLQLQGGIVTNLDISFVTEQDCLGFIHTEVIGAGMFGKDADQ